MGELRFLLRSSGMMVIPVVVGKQRVLIVVTVETEQLPVAAVGRIIEVIIILMVNCEFTQPCTGELAAAMRTDRGEQF